eukprot:TRINITY_DN58592_c0_g1_i1.p1 TRINITY_DN58592_c0_g1~~TRINITY_DN58592_c0_g1_i1.p1  ORF type:complete len:525 (-),score=70.63 TRINITY_DN58592_c0_g1_i1:200-1774(-)
MGSGALLSLTPDALKAIWEEHDLDKDGKLTLEEMQSVFQSHSSDIDDDQCEWLLKLIDKDERGSIDFDQFINFFFPPNARSPLVQEEIDARISLAELVRDLKAPMVLVSSPEVGARKPLSAKKFDAPVMTTLEQLPDNIDAHFVFAVDFAGSTTSQFAASRVRCIGPDGAVISGASDWTDMDYSEAYKGKPNRSGLPACNEHFRQQIENSFWINLWRGQVHGALIGSFVTGKELIHETYEGGECPILEPAGFEGGDDARFKVTIAVSIDGGAITRVEKTFLPDIFQGVMSNMRRRGGSASGEAAIVWCHFPTVEDFLHSLGGKQNLAFDEEPSRNFMSLQATDARLGKRPMRHSVVPATFKCMDDDAKLKTSKESLFRKGCSADAMMKLGGDGEKLALMKIVKAWCAHDEDGVLFILEKYPNLAKVRINDSGEHFPMDSTDEGDSITEIAVRFGLPRVFAKLVELGIPVDKQEIMQQLDKSMAETMVSMAAVLGEEEVAADSGEPPKREILYGQLALKNMLRAS